MPRIPAARTLSFMRATLLAMALVVPAPSAMSNDSTAILESGALQLTVSPSIVLEREDLHLGTSEVRVSYRFRNTSRKDIATLVAFPLPEITVGDDAQYDIGDADPANFIGFSVTVNGQPVTPELELRATRFGIDQTGLLARHGIPVLPFGPGFHQRLEAVSGAARTELERAGLVDWTSAFGANNKPLPTPHWKAHASYYWTQTFPAIAVTEVSHRYRPVSGVSFFYEGMVNDKALQQTYCMDEGFRNAALQRFGGGNAAVRELHYVLRTGANWLGTIGEFHLTIDKGAPGNLVSLCIDGIRKTGPTTFEVTRRNFIPEQDLKILVLEPIKAQ